MTPVNLPLTPEWLFWAYPWALLLLLAIPLYWFVTTRSRAQTVVVFSGLSGLRAAGGTISRRVRLILPLLRCIALACLVVAVARPQVADRSTQVYVEGIAIQLVVDVSSSMTDWDLSPPGRQVNRLDIVKAVVQRFVAGEEGGDLKGRTNDLVGLVKFARFPDSVCPLTLDHRALTRAVEMLQPMQPRSEEDGTGIGDGLALAVERLKDLKRTTGGGEQLTITSRVVILLTDGENNAGMITPEQAGELAANFGIKVYSIMAGTGQNEGFFRRPLNDRDLREIASVTGGKYFHATDARSLLGIYEEIDRLERTRSEERRFVRYDELSQNWLLVAFGAIALQILLDSTRLRKFP